MNNFSLFLDYGAVVKIRMEYRDDLYNFCKLLIKLGFMREELNWFLFSFKIFDMDFKNDKEKYMNCIKRASKDELLNMLEEYYADDYFWHIVEINIGMKTRVCIEYQKYKGFSFGKESDYLLNEDIKILKVEELIFACDMESDFNLNFIETTFKNELEEKDEELAYELDDFCDFYDWRLARFPNGLYGVYDIQCEEFSNYFNDTKEDSGTLRQAMERVFDRMVDYFVDEEDIFGLVAEGSIDYVREKINTFINLAKQYELYGEYGIKTLNELLEECEEENKKVEKNK